jgi:hypothetical protein
MYSVYVYEKLNQQKEARDRQLRLQNYSPFSRGIFE